MARVLTEVLARRFDEDAALIEEMLVLIPGGGQEELAAHLVEAWGGVCGCFQRLHAERLVGLAALQGEVARAAAGVEESRRLLGLCRAAIREGFALTSDADLARLIPTYFSPAGEPLLEVLLVNLKHVNHHAHQLFVELKRMGVPVGTRHLYRFRDPAL
jgi:hypothetical protein